MNLQTFQSKAFSSERLTYSLYQASDLEDVHSLLSIPEIDRFNTLGVMESIGQTEAYMAAIIEGHQADSILNFVAVFRLKENGQFVGLAGMHLQRAVYQSSEVWYKLLPELWGKGYATELLTWQLDFAFNHLKLHRVAAGCAVGNIASFKIMEKVGMRREGVSKKVLPLEEGWVDTFEYALLEEEYVQRSVSNEIKSATT